MSVILPEVPDGTHPWFPAEGEFTRAIQRDLEEHLRLAAESVPLAGDLLSRAQGKRAAQLFQVHATLLVRVLQDLRACVLCTLSGYPMQAWTVATSAFEAAHTLGFIGDDVERARQWLKHESNKDPFIPAYDAVTGTIKYLGIESDSAKRKGVVDESFAMYRQLCMAKHANPLSERNRYVYMVDGKANLVLTPPYTPRRSAESRLGMILALRSAHISMWAFDVTHLADPGMVDERVGFFAQRLGDLVETWTAESEKLRDASGA